MTIYGKEAIVWGGGGRLAIFYLKFLPLATKLGKSNIFRSVCQEFCSRGGGVSRPRPRGEVGGSGQGVPGPHLGDLQAHTWGGLQAYTQRGYPSMH